MSRVFRTLISTRTTEPSSPARSGGLELVKDLKARHNPLPVLVLSMHAEALYAERALRTGARGCIAKEASPSEAAVAIRKVMAGGIYVSQHVSGAILKRLGHATNEAVRPSGMDLLSDRELEVFQHAGRINLGSSTVDSCRSRIKGKLGIRNSAELYQRATQWVAESGLWEGRGLAPQGALFRGKHSAPDSWSAP